MRHDEKIYGGIGSIITLLLLFLLLWFVYIEAPYTPEEEGIMVSFGDSEEGGGMQTEEPASAPAESLSPPPTPASPSDNEYMTQEDEEALALQKQRDEEKKRKQQEEAERQRRQKEEQARLEAERIAKEKALAEQRAKEQAAIDKANQLGSLFGNSGTQGGANGQEGTTGTKGNPAGHGSSGGNSWSLNGRDLNGRLAAPSYSGNESGKIVVEIRVNAAGKVVSAKAGARGTNIADKQAQREAEAAAMKAVFSAGDGDVVGTITYVYVVN